MIQTISWIVLLWLVSLTSSAQTTIALDVWIRRVPIVQGDSATCKWQHVEWITQDEMLAVIAPSDTLVLHWQESKPMEYPNVVQKVWLNVLTNELYLSTYLTDKQGYFILMLTPFEPLISTHSLIISTHGSICDY